jgi:hypothetical protein
MSVTFFECVTVVAELHDDIDHGMVLSVARKPYAMICSPTMNAAAEAPE